MRAARFLALLLVLAPAVAAGQNVPSHPSERVLGGWIGASVAPSHRFGYITDRRLFVGALRAQFLIDTFGPIALANTVDLVPLAVLSNTPDYQVMSWRQRDGNVVSGKTEIGRSAVLGAGVAPIGLQLYTHSARPARLFFGTSLGALWFTRDTPVPDARRFNISADAGAGLELLARDGRVLVLGYKFQHLSNAGTAAQNPGFSTHLVYVGMMRRRGERRVPAEEPIAAR